MAKLEQLHPIGKFLYDGHLCIRVQEGGPIGGASIEFVSLLGAVERVNIQRWTMSECFQVQ